MVAVTADVAMGLPSPQVSDDREAMGVVLYGLRRFLAGEVIDEQLYEDLEAVHGEYAHPGPHLVTAIAARFRTAITTFVEIVPYVGQPCPVDEMLRLIYVSVEHPHPDDASGHPRRLALAILSILDLMGEAASWRALP
ncbi:hypothetical protein OG824_28150 [Streptomyces prunicolor]|uniref:hypothetical protein n=1 Tax=Streptomyces prunicolor TaxID=67348 RepID=UPI00224D12CE|nr:hypothetical protein [Streptomyces prunicolor]MCX5239077.1 hypothetical protein [Streptomyces prunicolor]